MALTPFRSDEAATYFGTEATFNSLPTVYRGYPINGTVQLVTDQAELEVEDESVYLYDLKDPVLGIKRGGAKFGYYLRPEDTLGTGALSAVTPLGILLTTCFGSDTTSAAGTTVNDPSATTTSVTVTSAANMVVGQWWMFECGGALYPSRISAIATNALTLDVALPSAPTNTGLVVAMHNWSHTANNTNTLWFEHIKANSTTYHKWSMGGGIGDVQLKTDRNALLRADFDFKFADWTKPSAESEATTVGAAVGSPFCLKDATTILQASTATTRTQFEIASFSQKLGGGMSHNESLSASGAFGALRTGQRSIGDFTIKLYADSTDDTVFTTWWQSRTSLQFACMVPQGSLLTKRWCVINAPKAHIINSPRFTTEGGRGMVEITLRPKMRNTSGATELARAPYVLAIG